MKTSVRNVAAASLMCAMLILLLSTAAFAQSGLYGVTFFDNQLIRIDPATGVGTLVGPLSISGPFGIASNNGRLYTFDATSNQITQINPTTGGTLASFNIGLGPVLGEGDLAFQNAASGFLTSALDPTTLDPVNDLYRFNIATGTSMLVAHLTDTLTGLAFAPDGVLYGLGKLDGNLYTVNTTTGGLTLVGNTGVSIGSPVGAITFGNGILYAALDDKLYTLNPGTGAATPVNADPLSNTGFNSVSGLAAVTPEPGSLTLFATVGFSSLGLFLSRRHRRK